MSEWFLSEMILCKNCLAKIWFSPEGYILCSCHKSQTDRPNHEKLYLSAHDIEEAVINDIFEKLKDKERLDRLTEATNLALAQSGVKFTAEKVYEQLFTKYDRVFRHSQSIKDKKILTKAVIKSITLTDGNFIEIEYHDL